MATFTFMSGKLEVKVRSGSRQGQVKFRSNKVQSPNTIFFIRYACLVQVCARTQKIKSVLVYDYKKCQKSHFKNIKTFVPALHRNSCAEVKFFFIARYAEGRFQNHCHSFSSLSVIIFCSHSGPYLISVQPLRRKIKSQITCHVP